MLYLLVSWWNDVISVVSVSSSSETRHFKKWILSSFQILWDSACRHFSKAQLKYNIAWTVAGFSWFCQPHLLIKAGVMGNSIWFNKQIAEYLLSINCLQGLVDRWLSCVRLFVTPWTVFHQAPLSMGFPRQEYWRRLPFPSPGDLPDPGIETTSPALQADSLPLSHQGSPSTRPWATYQADHKARR